MANQRTKATGRRESGSFILIPHDVLESKNWAQCSPMASRLFIDLLSQFKGTNNGDLCAALGLMKDKGWTRSQSITEAARELRHYGLIELTRQGGMNVPNLYAVTFKPINECKPKLDVPSETVASGLWKKNQPLYKRASCRRKNKKTPEH
jgi:hypothetical protein